MESEKSQMSSDNSHLETLNNTLQTKVTELQEQVNTLRRGKEQVVTSNIITQLQEKVNTLWHSKEQVVELLRNIVLETVPYLVTDLLSFGITMIVSSWVGTICLLF